MLQKRPGHIFSRFLQLLHTQALHLRVALGRSIVEAVEICS